MLGSSARRLDWWEAERRKEMRYTLILRAGVLEQNAKSSICLIRNISSSGVQLKCYAPPIADAEASIRVADEAPLNGRIVWIEGDSAGMTFDEELQASALLRVQQKLQPNRRRSMPRVDVKASAYLRTGGHIYSAAVCDISSMGVRIKTKSPLNPGDRAIITLDALPSLESYVRWTEGDEAGLVFETPIPMQIIAGWIDGSIPVTG